MNSICIKDNETLLAASRIMQGGGAMEEHGLPFRLALNLTHGDGFDLQNVESLIKHLQSTTLQVDEVRITPPPANVGDEWMMQLCSALGTHPYLSILSFCVAPESDPHFMTYMSETIRGARNLVSLSCSGVVFSGETKDYLDFAAVLLDHPTLQDVSLTGSLEEGQCTSINANPVLAALASIPNLNDLALSCFVPPMTESRSPFYELGGNPSLKTLDLVGTGGRGIIAASMAMKCSRSITTLWVDTSMKEDELYELGETIRHSQLESVHLYLDPFKDDDAMNTLIQALNGNPSLTKLAFVFHERENFFSNDIQDAMISMLEHHNYTLRHIKFDLSTSIEVRNDYTEATIEYFLNLNRLGRNHLLTNPNASRDDWIACIAAASGNLEAVHYFLSTNPSLCFA
ncbi:expressed unknown protein [Seminavis robusta]|uniref:Uncharacterized protein n=1 Tax=Seminavis robusta TaxID=568900 RepID=A0A9N8E7C9_9STRA|nr:expressed unknown protein [Seminavis robusta]|eukprot:Sro744_g196240.1 n/a (401) ;mRNA; f:38965-40167